MSSVRWRAALAVAVVSVSVVLSQAAPAQAHTELTKSSPAHRSTVTQQIAAVTLTFSGPVKAKGSTVTVTGPDQATYQTGALAVRDGVVTQPVLPLRSGGYTIAYRVVSGDGHAVTGSVTFTANLPAVPSPSPTLALAVVLPSASSPSPAASAGPADAAPVWPWLVLAGLVMALVGGVLVWRRRATAS